MAVKMVNKKEDKKEPSTKSVIDSSIDSPINSTVKNNVIEPIVLDKDELNDIRSRVSDMGDRVDGHTKAYSELTKSKDMENKLSEQVFSEEGGFQVQTRNNPVHGKQTPDVPDRVVPVRTVYAGRKLSISRSRMWLLQALSSLTPVELGTYREQYSKELSIDELEVIELLLRSLSGDTSAKQQVWDLQKEIFKTMKSVYVEELKNQRSEQENANNSRLASMLEEIGTKILESENDNNG